MEQIREITRENILNIISDINDKKSTISDIDLISCLHELYGEVRKIDLYSRDYLINNRFTLELIDNDGNVIIPYHYIADFADEGEASDGLYNFSCNICNGASRGELIHQTIENVYNTQEPIKMKLSILDACGTVVYEVNYDNCLLTSMKEPHFNYRDDSVSLFRIKGTYQNKSKKYYV